MREADGHAAADHARGDLSSVRVVEPVAAAATVVRRRDGHVPLGRVRPHDRGGGSRTTRRASDARPGRATDLPPREGLRPLAVRLPRRSGPRSLDPEGGASEGVPASEQCPRFRTGGVLGRGQWVSRAEDTEHPANPHHDGISGEPRTTREPTERERERAHARSTMERLRLALASRRLADDSAGDSGTAVGRDHRKEHRRADRRDTETLREERPTAVVLPRASRRRG